MGDQDEVEILRVLRLRGRATTDAIAASLGVDVIEVDDTLRRCEARSLVVHRDGRFSGWCLTDAGRAEHATGLVEERARVQSGNEVERAYDEFVGLNGDLKQLCTDWQLRAPRDDVLQRLEHVDRRIRAILKDAATRLPRMKRYEARFAAAADRFRSGNEDALTKPLSESYHDVWMELHQDFLLTLGRQRSAGDGN